MNWPLYLLLGYAAFGILSFCGGFSTVSSTTQDFDADNSDNTNDLILLDIIEQPFDHEDNKSS